MSSEHCHTLKNKHYHKISKNPTSISQEQSSNNIVTRSTHTQKYDNIAISIKKSLALKKICEGVNCVGNCQIDTYMYCTWLQCKDTRY